MLVVITRPILERLRYPRLILCHVECYLAFIGIILWEDNLHTRLGWIMYTNEMYVFLDVPICPQ
jgi:hypothetical protein